MTALAAPSDVRRMMRSGSTPSDAELQPFVDTAVEVVTKWLRDDFSLAGGGAQVAKYFSVLDDGAVPVPMAGATVTKVMLFRVADDPVGYDAVALTDWEVQDEEVRLHAITYETPFEGAVARHLPDTWARVEVTYTPPATVPKSIRDGVALTAAAFYQRAPMITSGMTGETIGDYSYQLRQTADTATGAAELIPLEAKAMMRWARKRSSMAV